MQADRMRAPTAIDHHPLDNPAFGSLNGAHRDLAQRHGAAVRYPPAFSPFAALPDEPGPGDWADLADLVGPGAVTVLAATEAKPPADWRVLAQFPSVQLVDAGVQPLLDDSAIRLGPGDVEEMLSLARRTKPGPFEPRTIELGNYIGFRRGGQLVAMAGERLAPPGWTELSAVCTDPSYRGQGFAGRLVQILATQIRQRDSRAFLHAVTDNVGAIGLYEALGFRLRRHTNFLVAKVPATLEPQGAP